MGTETVLVSPAGYDNVNEVLQQLGGSLANSRQLKNNEFHLLEDINFLNQFQHVFINCHRKFENDVTPSMISAIRNYVMSGHSLYASDWASVIVEASFEGQTAFKKGMKEKGTIDVTVKDPYLARIIGRETSINFDMSDWHLIEMFPASADIYFWDKHQRPLAVGFQAGQGRVVFTSFHHHAQTKTTEKILLQWLVTLPTQHSSIQKVQKTLFNYRATNNASQVVSRIGNDAQVIPVNLRSKSGLGVFTVAWEDEENTEFIMRYLRNDQVVKVEKSTRSPLVLTFRDPNSDDTVEIQRIFITESVDETDVMKPYVFAAGIRRDLLGDPSWLALAIERHIQKIISKSDFIHFPAEMVNEKVVLDVMSRILDGLGFVVKREHSESKQRGRTKLMVSSLETKQDYPELQIEINVFDRTQGYDSKDGYLSVFEQLFAAQEIVTDVTERLSINLVFSRGNIESIMGDDEFMDEVMSIQENHDWDVFASTTMIIGLNQDTLTVEELNQAKRLSIFACRLDEQVRKID